MNDMTQKREERPYNTGLERANQTPKRLTKYTLTMLLKEFGNGFNRNDGRKLIDKLAHDNPVKFFEVWIRLLDKVSIEDVPTSRRDASGLISAFQSGRFAEQLAAIVEQGNRHMAKLKIEHDNTPAEPVIEPLVHNITE